MFLASQLTRILTLSFLISYANASCFTIIAGKEATASGKVIIARNSESKDARRAKNLKIYATTEGTKLYIGLPYWDLAFDPSYDMAQVATNRYGVAISATQTIQSNRIALTLDPPTLSGQGVSEPNIPAIVMPHATSAKEGIQLLGKAIQARGVNDGWGFGVLIGDSQEAWYLETLSGHQWVAIRIPDNVYFVAANGAGQIQSYEPNKYNYLLSSYKGADPISFALNTNFAHFENNVFNFRETYGDVQRATNRNNNYVRIAYAQHLLNPSTRPFNQAILNQHAFPMFLTPEHLIQVDEIKTIQSSHYEDYPEFDPYLWSDKSERRPPFYYPIANPRTSNAHITEIGEPLPEKDYSLSNLEYIALGMPTLSFYLPIYYGLNTIPKQLMYATDHADNQSLFWQFRKLQALVFWSDPEKNIPFAFKERQAYIYKHYQALYEVVAQKQTQLEQQYQTLKDPKLIDDFTQETVEAVSQLNNQLINHFLVELNIDSQYKIKSDSEQNQWFTRTIREQDCFYRRYHCDPTLLSGALGRNKYVDE